MVDRIIAWSLRNRVLVVVVAAALLAWGSWEAVRLPVDVFPELTAPTVTVMVEAHGMAPGEVEDLVTFPIETALNGAAGVRRIRSSTTIGFAILWVEFECGEDIHRARQVVAEKLQLAASSLPTGVDPPVLAPISSIMGEILFIALTSDRHDPMELRTVADWTIRKRLLAVPGVSQVSPTGGDRRQYQVVANPERLSAYGLTLDDLARAVSDANENTSAGFLVGRGQEWLIHGVGRVYRPEDVEEAFVATRGDQPVRVRDVAGVRIGAEVKRGDGAHDGKPAVILGIQKQPTANTLELTRRLDDVLDDVQATLPAGMEIARHIFRQSDFIETSVSNVVAALRDGAVLVIAIVAVFLAGLRPTAITVLAIPLSLVVSLLVMMAFGITVNTMTLGGMAIAVGALVDDAIIDVENVVRRLRQNAAAPPDARLPLLDVVFEASREIRSSIVFATAIIVLVFLPLFFLTGVEGRLLAPLGFAYIVALAASLGVALTVTPALCALVLPRSRTITRVHEPWVVGVAKSLYRPTLTVALSHWKSVTAAAVAALAVAVAALLPAGQSFLPGFNEGTLTLGAVTLPGTSLEESNRLGTLVEQTLLKHPEVTATARRTGRAELDEHALGVNSAEIDVGLKMGERDKDEFLAALRADLAAIPGMRIVIGQPISHRIDHMLSGTRANVAVKVFGDDLRELRRLAEQVQATMEAVPGVVDLNIEEQTDIPQLTVRFDREAVARHGLTVKEVAETIETAFQGRAVSRVLEGKASFDLVVRYAPEAVADLDAVRGTLVATPSGARVPLHALADIRRDRSPSAISRENVQRKIVVACNVAGRDLRSVVDDVREAVAAQVPRPKGYHVEYGGQFESAAEASRTLTLLGGLATVGIFLLLLAALRSGRDAALVMVNLPLALIGGVAGVWVAGGVLSVASMIGFITLFGIATRNGLMMVLHIHHLVAEEGVTDPVEAVRRGATERLSPILMTALAAGLALIPLALGMGQPGSEIQAPMAIVILCGLVTSTALNMVVLPALYLRFGSVARGGAH
ncbi:MAG: efflux RND transporter permease subunit [Deltaproteobacteria bacterium]|nr:efflux RND transporter permease subunit [Deltaproteobacteria bacterium]